LTHFIEKPPSPVTGSSEALRWAQDKEVAVLQKIVVLAVPGTAPFEFGVICEVFGIDRVDSGGPTFDFHVVTADPGPVEMSLGFTINITEDLADDAELEGGRSGEGEHDDFLEHFRSLRGAGS
jgi:hypothetical protein